MDPSGCVGVPGCGYSRDPPPTFDLPPPPRPPWLEDLENCGGEDSEDGFGGRFQTDYQLETCDNVIMGASSSDFESAFHSVAVVVVCAILVVMFALALGVVIFR